MGGFGCSSDISLSELIYCICVCSMWGAQLSFSSLSVSFLVFMKFIKFSTTVGF